MKRVFPILALLMIPAVIDAAPVSVTATGTLLSSGTGYTAGDDFSVTFTIRDVDMTFEGDSGTGYMRWYDQDYTVDEDLFSAITGPTISGTWIRPMAADDDPLSRAYIYSLSQSFRLCAMSEYDTPLGLSFAGVDLIGINFRIELDGNSFEFDDTKTNLSDYLSSHLGPYSGTNFEDGSYLILSGDDMVYLDITSITISSVPEPAEFALMSGVGMLGLALWSRRRRNAVR